MGLARLPLAMNAMLDISQMFNKNNLNQWINGWRDRQWEEVAVGWPVIMAQNTEPSRVTVTQEKACAGKNSGKFKQN